MSSKPLLGGPLMRAGNLPRTSPRLKLVALSAVLLLFGGAGGCQPTIDLSGTYAPLDYPWSGYPEIQVDTSFPAPSFTGTFTLYVLVEYVEIPIFGVINDQDEAMFSPYNGDPPISGLCVCRGLDDGGSIYTGSGEIPDDGLADRLVCTTYLGQPFDPPAEVFRVDW